MGYRPGQQVRQGAYEIRSVYIALLAYQGEPAAILKRPWWWAKLIDWRD